MPIAAGARNADLLAVLLHVRGDEDQRKFGVVIVGLQIRNREPEMFREIAILRIRDRLVLEHDQPVFVEEVFELMQF